MCILMIGNKNSKMSSPSLSELRMYPGSRCSCPPYSQLLQSHGSTDRLVALLRIYEEEDQAYLDLVTLATTFFQYLLQPFRDMRELAGLYKMEILVNIGDIW